MQLLAQHSRSSAWPSLLSLPWLQLQLQLLTVPTLRDCRAAAAVQLASDDVATRLPAPEHLRVEGLLEAVAVISEPYPRFSFLHGDVLALAAAPGSPGFGVTQASYRIQVADADTGTPLWDSGDVKSANCSQIEYRGKPLSPFARFVWTVDWTSSAGIKSAQANAHFETGPMQPSDWQGAGWLNGTKSQFRNEFNLSSKQLVFARAYVAAAGCAHIEVNGKVPLPDLRGVCPWPVYSESVRYMTHDLHALVTPGRNALGIVAGNQSGRWTNSPQVIVLVVAKFAEERSPTFVLSSSSDDWMGRDPYVTSSTAWDATIDWTRQEQGWSEPGFKSGPSWSPVTAGSTDASGAAVSARALAMPRSTELGRVEPISVRKVADGSFLYEFPKNFVGTIEFAPLPSATNGSTLTVVLGEWLAPPPPTTPKPGRCGLVAENEVLKLGCPSGIIDEILFASWGTPVLSDVEAGCAAGFKTGICPRTGRIGNGANSLPVTEKFCLNKTECAIPADRAHFDDPEGPDACGGTVKALAAEVHCSGDPPGKSCKSSCYSYPAPGSPSAGPNPELPAATYPKISGLVQQYENHVLRAGNNKPLSTLF
eukprot:COSAG02_NODE_8960_length_2381_cov_2.740140_1_plen_593_part_01